ncbi:ubiquinol-cytochrome C chaperone [Devosia sp. L53-10-65]|uniref:Ubiquinol-cytochrome C chaperone n=1 Tax=Devosia marina TaxID=2683198 RepID=A0A7X3FNU6_9HYPH|nr:ubiquinol-cytochrome C chaperone [Devosia marina]
MNLTFPMAVDYRRDTWARAHWPPECVAVNLAVWQAGNDPAPRSAPCLTDTDAERNPMIMSLFRKKTATEPVYAVYNSIVAQSRRPVLYAQWGVPDTVTGRFDMISLHMALLFRRLRNGPDGSREFSQSVFDLFFKDMDRSLREMGVSDLGVPKKIQKMGNIFFGLLAAMNDAMDRNDADALASVLARNVFDGQDTPELRALADYVFACDAELATQPVDAITAGSVRFEATA